MECTVRKYNVHVKSVLPHTQELTGIKIQYRSIPTRIAHSTGSIVQIYSRFRVEQRYMDAIVAHLSRTTTMALSFVMRQWQTAAWALQPRVAAVSATSLVDCLKVIRLPLLLVSFCHTCAHMNLICPSCCMRILIMDFNG